MLDIKVKGKLKVASAEIHHQTLDGLMIDDVPANPSVYIIVHMEDEAGHKFKHETSSFLFDLKKDK